MPAIEAAHSLGGAAGFLGGAALLGTEHLRPVYWRDWDISRYNTGLNTTGERCNTHMDIAVVQERQTALSPQAVSIESS